jgi:hypothetical protein
LRIKNLTHTFMNTMFYFRINASIVAFLSDHISFGILMTTFFKICFKILKVYTKGKQGDDRGDLSRLSPQNLWELQCFVSGFWEKGGGGDFCNLLKIVCIKFADKINDNGFGLTVVHHFQLYHFLSLTLNDHVVHVSALVITCLLVDSPVMCVTFRQPFSCCSRP